MSAWLLPFSVVLSYLLGSIPTAYIFVRYLRGVDIRTQGSGNVGATNAGRILGRRYFVLILVLDILKGIAAVQLGLHLLPQEPWAAELCGLGAIVGHAAPVFLRFRGGKAVATSCGVFGCLAPVPTALSLAAFGLVRWVSGYVSLGSIVAAAALPLSAWLLHTLPQTPAWARPTAATVALAALSAILVVYLHRSNIARLLAGEEHR